MAFININFPALATAGPVLVIMAEMWRVVGITSACGNITQKALDVAMRLEEIKTDMVNEKDIKVRRGTKLNL